MGAPLLALLNEKLEGICLHGARAQASVCADACAKGAASLLIEKQIPAMLSDTFAGWQLRPCLPPPAVAGDAQSL
jgi:hypothetical protein